MIAERYAIMLEEQVNIQKKRSNERPDGIGISIIARFEEASAAEMLTNIVTVWTIVASWRRWSNTEQGAWPETEQCLEQLPDWFGTKLHTLPQTGREN